MDWACSRSTSPAPRTHQMANNLNPEPQKYYVLLMTATVAAVTAMNEMEAANSALIGAPPQMDPTQLSWVVRHVSDVPIELGELEEPQAPQQETTPETTAPKLTLLKG